MDEQTLGDIGTSPTKETPERERSIMDNQLANEEELKDDTELAAADEVDESAQ